MKIDSVSQYMNLINTQTTGESSKADFSKMFGDYLDDVNSLQKESDYMDEQLASGEVDNIHDVMIKAEEARIALEMTVQIRNKVVEAYQELIRMQV